MNRIVIIGAGAFGTALALVYARSGKKVRLCARDADDAKEMAQARMTGRRLPGHELPTEVSVMAGPCQAGPDDILLCAVPTQKLGAALRENAAGLSPRFVVACCKGIDLETGKGPTATIRNTLPGAAPVVLTGPSFAVDLAKDMPTALTLATDSESDAALLQARLSTPVLRLYRTTDTLGAELGGALKNVVALAAGIAIGAGLGDSARAAVIARGFAEMQRFALARGAKPETLSGLSGLGDLVLTSTSSKSRNFSTGVAIGAGEAVATNRTIEGLSTAKALNEICEREKIEMPLSQTVHAIASGRIDVAAAVEQLMARPLRTEAHGGAK